jgi:hypothetical protein
MQGFRRKLKPHTVWEGEEKVMTIDKQTDKLFEIILPIFRTYYGKYKIEEIYDYKINHEIYRENGLFSIEEQNKLEKSSSIFEENSLLKDIVSKKIKLGNNKIRCYNWVVKKWGGIPKFKKPIEFINDFFEELNSGIMGYKYYSIISSLSKIAAFKSPEDFFIYDSRVAFTLNWLLIKSKKETLHFFIPKSRNKFIIENLNDFTSLFNGEYLDKNVTYTIYNKLIKKIYQSKLKFDKVFCVEMFLWGLFEKIKPEIKQVLTP